MPLELGMAMAERFGEGNPDDWHDWLVLVPNGHGYGTFISDLAGYDPKRVEQTVESVVAAVMGWLSTRPDAVVCPTPHDVLEALPEFVDARTTLKWKWRGHEPWREIVKMAIAIARKKRLIVI